MGQVDKGRVISRTALWNYSRWKELEKSLSSFVSGGSMIERERVYGCLDEVFERVIGVAPDRLKAENFVPNIDPRAVIDTAWSGERFSTRIWNNRAALAERIRIDMEDMIVQGRGLGEMKKELMHEFGVGYQQADTLLRTELNYVMNQAHLERYRQSSAKKVRWMAKNREAKRCKICGGRNKAVWWIDSAPVLPAHPRCGCRWVAVIELEGENVPVNGPEIMASER
jgi:SPP1 gp7 family putative phage head morphogenesis protein